MGIELECPECGGRVVFDPIRGELACSQCGLVLGERFLDPGPEWRAFTGEERERRARTGPPSTGLRPSLAPTDVSEGNGRYAARLRRRWSRISLEGDRDLLRAVFELERLGSQLGLPQYVVERGFEVYRMAQKEGLVKGRSMEAAAAAAVYFACREHRIPRSLDEVAEYSRASRRDIARCYRKIVRELGLRAPLPSPADFVPRICENLGLSHRVAREAFQIVEKARELGVGGGRDPAGLAAAAVYLAAQLSGEHRIQKLVAKAAGVTEVTVRNNYKRVAGALGLSPPVLRH